MAEEPEFGIEIEVESEPKPGRTILRIRGEIDLVTAPKLREPLLAALARPGAEVVVDLNEVTFLGSNGLGLLVEASTQAKAAGAHMRLVCANRPVLRPLSLTGLDQVLEIYSSLADLPT